MNKMIWDATDAFLRAIGHSEEDVKEQRDSQWPPYRDSARAMGAAIAAYQAAIAEAGFVIVPREPTEEMCEEGVASGAVHFTDNTPAEPEKVWRAMIAASPKPPSN